MSNSPLISYTKLSPNCNKPRKYKIDTITPHHMAGNCSVETCGEIFANPARQCSSNYGIGSDGRIAMYCEEANRSWCSSSAENDHRAITVEIANDSGSPEWHVSDEAVEAFIKLCVDICERNGMNGLLWKNDKSLIGDPSKQNITIHPWFSNTGCLKPYMINKLPYVVEEVNKRLGGNDTDITNSYTEQYESIKDDIENISNNIESLEIKLDNIQEELVINKEDLRDAIDDLNKLKDYEPTNVPEKKPDDVIEEILPDTVFDEDLDNDEIIWKYLSDPNKGLKPHMVAGIMGNLYAESMLVPVNLQNSFESTLGMSDQQYTDNVDNGSYEYFVKDGAGYGLAQWTWYERKEKLLQYAKARKVSIGDMQMQLDFLWNEMNTIFTDMLACIRRSRTILEVSNLMLFDFERPANQSERVQEQRLAFSEKIYDKFNPEIIIVDDEVEEFKSFLVKVKIDSLNYREGPGISYKIKGQITKNQVYTIVETKEVETSTWGKMKSGVWINISDKYVSRV